MYVRSRKVHTGTRTRRLTASGVARITRAFNYMYNLELMNASTVELQTFHGAPLQNPKVRYIVESIMQVHGASMAKTSFVLEQRITKV